MNAPVHDRRAAAARIAALALLPAAALGAPLAPLLANPRPVECPGGPFELERILTRGLADGAAIVVTRRWQIRFAPRKPGLTVDGRQIFVDVSAPPVLAPLAALERARSTAGMFPIALDEQGLIVNVDASADDTPLQRAIAASLEMFRSRAGDEAANDATHFMTELARAGSAAVSATPRDLFFPASAPDSSTRQIDLPGGGSGSISVETAASVDPATGLLRSIRRSVRTRIADDERRASELWALSRL